MGLSFCGFRRRSGPNRSSNQDTGNDGGGLTASMMKLMKPRCLLGIRKRPFQAKEKQEQSLHDNNCSKVLTLEDRIISSPAFNITNTTNISGCDEVLHAPKESSRKIHPSLDECLAEELFPKFMEGFSMEISTKTDEVENGQFCRAKMKKKVSFRSPEVAVVFVLQSPEEMIYVQ